MLLMTDCVSVPLLVDEDCDRGKSYERKTVNFMLHRCAACDCHRVRDRLSRFNDALERRKKIPRNSRFLRNDSRNYVKNVHFNM